jgi:hypothetical protein
MSKEQYERRKAEDGRRNQDQQPKRGPGRSSWRHPDYIARFTFWVATFTFVLAGVSLIQVWAFIQSERAAIYPYVDRIDPTPVVSDQPIAIDVTIINNGRAQAFFSEARVAVWAGTSLPNKPDFSKATFVVSGVIPPQGRRHVRFGPVEEAFNWAQIKEIDNGTAKLWVYGYVTFTDDFSLFGAKSVGFCGIYLPPKLANIAKPPGPPIADCLDPNYVYYK